MYLIINDHLPRKQHIRKPKQTKILNPHRIQNPLQMIAFMLHHARMKTADGAINCCAVLIQMNLKYKFVL